MESQSKVSSRQQHLPLDKVPVWGCLTEEARKAAIDLCVQLLCQGYLRNLNKEVGSRE
jgi:hypothetical protein